MRASLSFLSFLPLTAALPNPSCVKCTTTTSNATSFAKGLRHMMPNSVSCDGAKYPEQCRTADQAAPFLLSAFEQYGMESINTIAAVTALVGLESGDFKYQRNIYPSRPGQGTSAMLMPNFVEEYARSISELADKVDGAKAQGPDAVLALVLPNQYSFGAAQWFLATKCADALQSFESGTGSSNDNFKSYMDCVGVTIDASRQEYWTRAKTALGVTA